MEEALWVCRFAQFTTAMMLFGTACFRLLALPRASIVEFEAWARRFTLAGAVAALISTLAFLLCQTAVMANSAAATVDPATLGTVLLETRFGWVWSWQLLISLTLVPVCSGRSGRRQLLVLTLSALLLAGLAQIGHAAMEEGIAGAARQLNQFVHLLAAGLWLGGLLPLGWVLRRARATQAAAEIALADSAIQRFSQIGYIAVAFVAMTGALNSLVLVGSFEALVSTPYGRLLAFKVLLFLAMVGTAFVNRFRLAPRISENPAALSALCRNVGLEQLLGLSILGIVSILGTWPPAINGGGR